MANNLLFQENLISTGDVVRVHFGAGNPFEGIVLAIRGRGENKSFTVRRIGVMNIGIERIFPLSSPLLTKIEVKKKTSVRRAKLSYLRNKKVRK